MEILIAPLERQIVQQITQSSINPNVNLISNFESFDPDKEDFSHYKQLENYLRKNIFDDKNTCVKVLLN